MESNLDGTMNIEDIEATTSGRTIGVTSTDERVERAKGSRRRRVVWRGK
jgi:hypothetical protein